MAAAPSPLPALPASLEPVRPYFDRAAELAASQPMVAHHLRVFGMQLAMKIRHADAGAFLMAVIELLEKEKQAGLPLPPPKTIMRPVAAPAPAPAPAPVQARRWAS